VRRGQLGGIGVGLLDLQVGLSGSASGLVLAVRPSIYNDGETPHSPVQIACLDIGQPLGLTARQQDAIRRYEIIILQPDQIADLQVSPRLVLETGRDGVQHLGRLRVELSVRGVSFLRTTIDSTTRQRVR
jgi:hypothetical protein